MDRVPAVKSLSERTALAGDWKIIVDDRKEFAEAGYDDSAWETVKLPGSFAAYARSEKPELSGTVWLRKNFIIDPSLRGRDLGLILGRIGIADETFVNGSCIGGTGKFPPDESSMWNHPRHYQIPAALINYDSTNVIAVRVHYYIFGEVLGTLALTDTGDLRDDSSKEIFSRVVLGYVVIAMGLPIILISLLLFILRKDDEYLYYLLQMLIGFFIVLEVCNLRPFFPDTLTRFKIFGFAWAALNVVHPIFLHRFYGLKRKFIERALLIYLLLTAVFFLTISGLPSDMTPIVIFIALTTAIGGYNLSCHASAIYLKKPFTGLFSFFGIMVILGAIHDGLVYFVKFSDISIVIGGYVFRDHLIFHYTAGLLYTGTMLVLVYRFVSMTNQIESLNLSLEKKVEERTCQLSDALTELNGINSMLSEIAVRDSLTGLYNHAAMHERLKEILGSSWRHGFPLSLIMMDIDHFKTINDTYGHQTGDEVILAVADVLHSGPRIRKNNQPPAGGTGAHTGILRESDIAGRYGGDEFMLILPYCDREGAIKSAERILDRFRNIIIPDKPGIKITGSFGVVTVESPDLKPEPTRMIGISDKAMYESKEAGRNRVSWQPYTQPQHEDEDR
jgi:GGDEF domain-containing protein